MKITRLHSQADLATLRQLATSDGHGVFRPTHLFRDGPENEIVGYLSHSPLPFVAALWTHSQRVNALRSARALAQLAAVARFNGAPAQLMRCDATSPYFPEMTRLGFRALGPTHLFELDT